SFSYPPRLDYQRLACRLGRMVEAVCLATGASQVDLVGHSLGGLIARYLTEMGDGGRVRRVVTLGAPSFSTRIPPLDLAVFGGAGTSDPADRCCNAATGAGRSSGRRRRAAC